MSSVYENVNEHAAPYYRLEKAKLLLSLERLFPNPMLRETPPWLHIIAPVDYFVADCDDGREPPPSGEETSKQPVTAEILKQVVEVVRVETQKSRDLLEWQQTMEASNREIALEEIQQTQQEQLREMEQRLTQKQQNQLDEMEQRLTQKQQNQLHELLGQLQTLMGPR